MVLLGLAYKKPPRNSRADMLCVVEKVWGVGGSWQETPVIPDEPDVLDGGDVVHGVGGGGLAMGRLMEVLFRHGPSS
jgi:hypothetical protein